jgi:hypothetical protein
MADEVIGSTGTEAGGISSSPQDSFNFDDVLATIEADGIDEGERIEAPKGVEKEAAGTAKPASAGNPPPAAPPAAQPPVPAQPSVQAQPQPPVPPAPPAQAAPVATSQVPSSPQQNTQAGGPPPAASNQQAEWEAHRAKREAIAKEIAGRYTINEEQATLLATAPEKVLPDMIGRLYVDIFEAVLLNAMQQLPQVIPYHVQQVQRQQEAQRAFFTRWPSLRKPEYGPVVQQIAGTIRQLQPQLTGEDFVEQVGTQVSLLLKLPLDQRPGAQPPAAPPVQPPVPQAPLRPHAPANPGGSAPAAMPGSQPNFWASFAQEIEDL